MKNFRMNWPRFWIGLVWWLVETHHYGWNDVAESDAEMICDAISLVLLALAVERAHSATGNGREQQ